MMPAEESFRRIRAEEERSCPQCGYTIVHPLVDRCPRCFGAVERTTPDCGACTHQARCDIAILQGKEREQIT